MAQRKYSKQLVVTAGAYSANEVIGGQIQFVGLRNAVLNRVVLVDEAGQNVAYYLVLYDAVQTNIADNGVMNPVQGDAAKTLAIISLPTANRVAFQTGSMTESRGAYDAAGGLNITLKSAEGDGDIYGFLFTPGTPTYVATTDVTINLFATDIS